MSPSLASLVADVYTLTNRPDLVGETLIAIRAATLKAHRVDYFYKDLFETGVQFDVSQFQQALEYKTLVPLWRSLKYVRSYDYTTPPGTPGKFLETITPDNVLDSYSVSKENVCYVAGVELQIRCSPAQKYFLLGCYVNPDVTVEGFSSWIAQDHPFAIVFEAVATVFKTIGFDEQVTFYRQLVSDEYKMLIQSNILATGE